MKTAQGYLNGSIISDLINIKRNKNCMFFNLFFFCYIYFIFFSIIGKKEC